MGKQSKEQLAELRDMVEGLQLSMLDLNQNVKGLAVALATIGPCLGALVKREGMDWDKLVAQVNRQTDAVEAMGRAVDALVIVPADESSTN